MTKKRLCGSISMKLRYLIGLFLVLLALSCRREEELHPGRVPDGEPVTLHIGFGTPSFLNVEIGTKSEASRADESYVHDLYVMIFDADGRRFYNRYFTYEHKSADLATLEAQPNEGWYVENSEYDGDKQAYTTTRGVVKVSTVSRQNCTLVVLANVNNSITTLNGERDALDCLSDISTLEQLHNVKVTMRQEIVNRTDLFMMLGMTDPVMDTGSSVWGSFSPEGEYNEDGTKVMLNTLEAKVKFYVSYDETYINPSSTQARHWKVYNAPSAAYLTPHAADPDNVAYFSTEEAYFEGSYRDANDKVWQIFSFYVLENRQSAKINGSIEALAEPDYYLREKQEKSADPKHEGYEVNGDWLYAPTKATYVKFDLVMGFTDAGIKAILGQDTNFSEHALSSEVRYTIHLGDFTSSEGSVHNFDNYDVARGHAYSYYITIQNSEKVYVEVAGEKGDTNKIREDEPGQEGSLMLATTDLVNCDAHYEYHCMTFDYDRELDGSLLSWYVKTPFGEGAAHYDSDIHDWVSTFDDDQWVMFRVNDIEYDNQGNPVDYSDIRQEYPGIGAYDPTWRPSKGYPCPDLMDIHQLVMYIFDQTDRKRNPGGELPNDFVADRIRVTAFVDEYYYESDPLLKTGEPDPDLWRKFVNAKPRELHILSNAQFSKDRQSTVVTSTHAIIQQSIQSFYNVYSPNLSSLWGTEHTDEMSYVNRVKKDYDGQHEHVWRWWPEGVGLPAGTSVRPTSDENGRMNTAALWGLYTNEVQHWTNAPEGSGESYTGFLYYNVRNVVPELLDEAKYLAYSCLTRNRDNDGDGIIEPEELRWYTASVNQLVGMWVGYESLSKSARLYQPIDASDKVNGLNWRSWVVSSTADNVADPVIIRAEEAATRSDYTFYDWAGFSKDDRDKVSSVRCVRNIGTYQDNGVTKDVTRAPYDFMVNQYYEFPAGSDANGKVLPNEDGTYTVRFTNLNPKSVREYTENDLPYHDESSVHNQVYLELNMQSDAIVNDGVSIGNEETINKTITRNGYNTYCPEGYRLPNMTELLLMRALQPSSYWRHGANYPCRTFYSRGKLGGNRTDSEEEKIGWGYMRNDDRVHLTEERTNLNGVRCVRDRNRTGDITGKITVDNADHLVGGEYTTLNLNFSSAGSAITDIALALVYMTTDGMESTRPIPLGESVELGGVTVRTQQEWHIPDDMAILGRMAVRATVRNAAGITRSFETPVKLLSEVFTSLRLLHCEYDEADAHPDFPILVTASSPFEERPIVQMNLYIMDPGGDIQRIPLNIGSEKHYVSQVYGFQYDDATLQDGTYTFQLETVTAFVDILDPGVERERQATRSSVATMEILKHDYWPNPLPEGENAYDYWGEASDITGLWDKQEVKNMNFSGGDFIEANMDVRNCTYKQVPAGPVSARVNDRTVGRDNLISVGITDTDYTTSTIKTPNVFHVFYPAHDDEEGNGKDWLRLNPSTPAGNSNGCNYKWFTGGSNTGFVAYSASFYKPDPTCMQHFRLDYDGVWWNNQKVDLSRNSEWNPSNATATFNNLRNATTVYVGSTQGLHHSRAGYMFVRVVHNGAANNAAGGSVNLGDGPFNGGEL